MAERTGAQELTWDLTDLYESPRDPALAHDLNTALTRARAFETRYRGTINVPGGPSPEWIATAVAEIESIYEQADRPSVYAELLHAADARPPEHGALVAQTQEQQTQVHNHLVFLLLEWMAVDEAVARRIVEAPECARYRHYLVTARQYRPHVLSEPEEKLLEETANTGPRAFCRLLDELLSGLVFEVEVDGARQRLNESGVLALLHDPRRVVRQRAAAAMTQQLCEQRLPLTFILNVSAQHHALHDRLRRFPDPMAARNLSNQIEAGTVAALIQACERHVDIVAEYYGVKRRLLGIEVMYDYDRYAPVASASERWSWSAARNLVLQAFGEFSPRLREIATLFFERRWIDAEVREGKRGGAFSARTVPSAHPYVLLSYLGCFRDVATLAHELGHGVHQYLSRGRGYLQGDTPLTLAETASVFGELLVFERLRRQQSSPATALAFLCEFLEEAFGTVFRQIALTRFEQRVHERRRRHGELSSDEIGAIWHEVNGAMYGDAVMLTEDYRWWWAYIPHFVHSPFYCYAYSFGELLVLALYELYRQQGDAFVPKYLDLLAAGGSAAPGDLLRRLDVDIQQPAFWELGLNVLRRMVGEVKELARGCVESTGETG